MTEDVLRRIEAMADIDGQEGDVRKLVAEVRRLRTVIQGELDGCWCDDRDGNCNPPHNPVCERCARLSQALQ